MEIQRRYLDDTAPGARRMLVERWRAMTPAEKGAIVSAASRALHDLQVAGLALRHPGASAAELERLAVVQRLGPGTVDRIAERCAPPGAVGE